MFVQAEERAVLRELAKQLADAAANPVYADKRELWRKKNSLIKVRPLVLGAIPEAAWFELIPEDSLVTKHPVFRGFERYMRRKLYKSKYIRDDDVLSNKLYVPLQYTVTDWADGHVQPYSSDAGKAAAFEPCILQPEDIKKLKMPQIVDVDTKTANELFDEAQEIFGGILDVQLGEPYYSALDNTVMGIGNGLVDTLCELRGLENIFYDMVSRKEFVHELMEFITAGHLGYLDQMEKYNLLRLNNNEYMPGADTPLNSNGLGITDELPGEPYNPAHITTENLWGYVQAQEFTVVSKDMLVEFIHPYHRRIAQRFGLVCYGCCEKEDKKWDAVIQNIPNLRELSVAFNCDLHIAADKIKDNYVFSWKPHATMVTHFEEEPVRREIQEGFEITKNCHMVLSIRDVQTFNGRPDSITKWTDLAMELAQEYS